MIRQLIAAGVVVLGATGAAQPPAGERLVKVYGDLATAERVAIIVPGSDTTAATFENSTHRPGGAARALLAEARRLDPGARVAVVAWLGYDSPATWSTDVLTEGAADDGARALRQEVTGLRARTSAPISLLCHSYGSVVCAKAAPGLPLADVALFGSPGTTRPTAAALTSGPADSSGPADASGGSWSSGGDAPRVWAGRQDRDWVSYVPDLKIGPFGFGGDPMDPAFGARLFATGPGGHSDYFTPGTASLRNLALITLGRAAEVSHG
ncbi:alpha/beta hydrolase [Nonomuraea africana]|uniref:alpha/beta hydrolase n=1 Tax=Nonomuraea africana TaxID=46171 RepID=UPI0033F5FB21